MSEKKEPNHVSLSNLLLIKINDMLYRTFIFTVFKITSHFK